ncbi:uncharacterized protein LOC132663107 isoform X1 [Panthera onca]
MGILYCYYQLWKIGADEEAGVQGPEINLNQSGLRMLQSELWKSGPHLPDCQYSSDFYPHSDMFSCLRHCARRGAPFWVSWEQITISHSSKLLDVVLRHLTVTAPATQENASGGGAERRVQRIRSGLCTDRLTAVSLMWESNPPTARS